MHSWDTGAPHHVSSPGSAGSGDAGALARLQLAVTSLAESLPGVVREAEVGLTARLDTLGTRLAALERACPGMGAAPGAVPPAASVAQSSRASRISE